LAELKGLVAEYREKPEANAALKVGSKASAIPEALKPGHDPLQPVCRMAQICCYAIVIPSSTWQNCRGTKQSGSSGNEPSICHRSFNAAIVI